MTHQISVMYQFRKLLIEKNLILPTHSINYSSGFISIEGQKVSFGEIVNIKKSLSKIHNYSFILALIFFIIGTASSLIYYIYIVETTIITKNFTYQNVIIPIASKKYQYNFFDLVISPLVSGLFWAVFMGLLGRFIKKVRSSYIILTKSGDKIYIYPSKLDMQLMNEFDWSSFDIECN